jgi:hypothetical protein
MPQLDFREALSTPEEKLFSPAATIAPVPAAAPTNQTKNALLRGVDLSRSTWTNIFFVTIASVGGLACAFYFFNGGELLRAAAAWPNEFLYPRPLSTDKIGIGQQPNPVDQFSESTSGSSKSAAAQGSPEKNVSPANLTEPAAQSATTIGTTNPTGVGPLDPGASLISDATSLVSGLNLLPPATDTLFQSSYQTAISMTPKTTITRTTKNSVSSTRRKVSTTRQKLTPTIKSATSTAGSTQQSANQNQVGMSAPNQMMTSGGMGGISGIGGVGAVGGVGGVSGAGLGGGISGTGLGGLGGIIHH